MGFIGDVFKKDEETLIIDRKKQAMKMLIIFSAVLFVVLIVLIVVASMGDVDKERREKITVDMTALRAAMQTWNQEAMSNPDFVYPGIDLNRSGDVSAQKLIINGIEEEYRYGYYHIKPEDYIDRLEARLNFSNEQYYVNYNTLDIVNLTGIKYAGGRFHSMEDLVAIGEIEDGRPDVVIPSKNTIIIKNPNEMIKLHENPNARFKLAGNIDMSAYTSNNGWNPVKDFAGTFDGRGYTISNLTIKRPTERYVGLFGNVNGTIRNVTFENADVIGEDYTGVLAGTMSGHISNITIKSGNVKGGNSVGGLVGAHQGNIAMCRVNLNSVAGEEQIGGVVGTFNYGSIREVKSVVSEINGNIAIGGCAGLVSASNEAILEECAVTIGSVETNTDNNNSFLYGEPVYAAGIVGNQDLGGMIGRVEILNQYALRMKNCYAEGYIREGNSNKGGMIGRLRLGSSSIIDIKDSYTAVEIPEKNNTTGGCIGELEASITAALSAVNVYWLRDLAVGEILEAIGGESSSKDLLNFTHKSRGEMNVQNGFKEWKFDTVWEMNHQKARPTLRFENTFINY